MRTAPPRAEAVPPNQTTQADMERALRELDLHKAEWVGLGAAARAALIEQIQRDLLAVLPEWITLSREAKGIAPGDLAEGDEWGGVAIMFRVLRQLKHTLRDIAAQGRPQPPGIITTRADGQVLARVLPARLDDHLIFTRFTADVWMQPGVTAAETSASMGLSYQRKAHTGQIALVLGAGNYSPLTPMDFLHKLFQEDQVVIVKMNPANAYLGPLYERGFRALVERGFLRVVYGGTAEAAYLVQHPLVDELHLTGSDRTYEAIVFGTGAEGQRRKAQRQPMMTKRFTAELGCITPVIVVPGPWTERDLRHHAANIANMLMINAGFNCVTARVIVQHANWPQRWALNRAIGRVLAGVRPRKAYYPGAQALYADFLAAHPEAERYGQPAEGDLPWTFIPDLNAHDEDEICFQREAFCSLFAETGIEAASPAEFIDRAVAFCNERVWGTLTATLIVHPQSLRDPAVAAAVERAVANLRYGTVSINMWSVIGIFLGVTPWGGFPGAESHDIQSGTGFTNNTFMFAHPQKSVVRAPFWMPLIPLPVNNRHYHTFYEKLVHYEAAESPLHLPGIVWDVLTGLK